jgi:hypothetical protein
MCANKLAKRLVEEIETASGGVTAIAKYLGKTRNTIYNWCEKGNIPADQLVLLAGIGIDIQYVITGVRSTPSKDELSPQEGALIEKYRLLSDSDKAHSQAVVSAFADKGSEVKKGAK